MKKTLLIIGLLALVATSGINLAFAHSGGTDSLGCHTDHSTGIYHCH